MPSPLQEMLAALEDEIAALRQRGGGSRTVLQGGEQTGVAEGQFLYRFLLEKEVPLRDDAPVRIGVDRRQIEGNVVSVRDLVVVVALSEDLGPRVARASLIIDNAFLVEALRDRLKAVEDRKQQPYHLESANLILGSGIRSGVAAAPIPLDDLNAEQRAAVARALGSNATFVWGPPGTGKTQTLIHLIQALFTLGKSVFVVSNTNAAVDQVAARLIELLGFADGDVLRAGPTENGTIRDQIGLDAVAERHGRELKRRQGDLQPVYDRLATEVRALLAAIGEHEEMTQAAGEVHRETRVLEDAIGHRVQLKSEIQATEGRLRGAEAEMRRVQQMNGVARFFSGRNLSRIEQELQSAQRRAGALAADLAETEALARRTQTGIRRLKARLTELESRSHLRLSLASCRAHLPGLEQQRDTVGAELAAIAAALGGLREELLRGCRVLLMTASRLSLPKQIPARDFDAVVIDEASMLMLPMTYYAAGLAINAVVVAGDFRQLPAIVASNSDRATTWLQPSAFEKAGIPEYVDAHKEPPHLVALRAQYRMAPPICDIVANLFYNGNLYCAPEILTRDSAPLFEGVSRQDVLYVDTTALRPWAALREGSGSRFNLLHAMVVRQIAAELCVADKGEALGVVTPYAAQSHLLRTVLKTVHPGIIAATAHRFQGGERDVIIVDLTESPGAQIGRFLQATAPGEEGSRLLNVAISRAKHCLIVVANFGYIRARAPRSITARLLERITTDGASLDTVDPLAAAARTAELFHLVAGDSPGLPDAPFCCTERTFLSAFAHDLADARERVIILAPFITEAGVGRLADLFRGCLARGVQVRVITRPAREGNRDEQDVAGLLDGLRALGVTVETRPRMHEKAAFIDQTITWQGSLNILSYGSSTEIMFRYVSAEFGESVATLLLPPARRPSGTAPRPNGAPSAQMERDQPKATVAPGSPCPECKGRLVKRNSQFGPFLGCSRFPACRFTSPLPGPADGGGRTRRRGN